MLIFCNDLHRVDDAIDILEYVVGMREEELGTANPDVDDEKRRLADLLKEAGRAPSSKSRRSLQDYKHKGLFEAGHVYKTRSD